MTVYELIKELTKYEANSEIRINLKVKDFDAENVENGEDIKVNIENDWLNINRFRKTIYLSSNELEIEIGE